MATSHTTTFTTTLNCGSCVATVTPFLDRLDDVTCWSVDTNRADKPLTVEWANEPRPETVIDAVRASGFEARPEGHAPQLVSLSPPSPAQEPFRLSRYRPLLIVVGYIVALTGYLEYRDDSFNVMRAMRTFMGFFFVGFAFFKLIDVRKFADAFATYDVVAGRSRAYALTYPFLELALGAAYLFNIWPLVTNGITAVVMVVGLVGVIGVLRRGQVIQCACLGTAFNLPMSVVTVIENGLMLAMAIVGLWQALNAG